MTAVLLNASDLVYVGHKRCSEASVNDTVMTSELLRARLSIGIPVGTPICPISLDSFIYQRVTYDLRLGYIVLITKTGSL